MKWLVWSIPAIFILVTFAPSAYAQDQRTGQIEVNFQPQFTDSNSTTANLMDSSTVKLEKDVMIGALQGIEGKYYGPYLQSSLFEFKHEGRYFQFATNFTIGPEVIMNGASTFWVRVPIVPFQYHIYHVYCSWGHNSYLESDWGFLGMGGPQSPWDLSWWYVVDGIWTIPDSFLGNSEMNFGPGNVWSVKSGDTYQILNRPSGLYIEYKGIFHPNEQFSVIFTGLLNDGEYPQVFLTQERPDLNTNQSFFFYDTYSIAQSSSIIDRGFKYRSEEDLAIAPAWAFIFTNGIGKEGLTSYKLKFASGDDYISYGHYPRWNWSTPGASDDDVFSSGAISISNYTNHSYISYYMPFSGQVLDATTSGQNTIDWKIEITLGMGYNPGGNWWWMFFNKWPYGLANTSSITLYVNNTENYLLFTAPYRVDFNWTLTPWAAPPNRIDVFIRLTPLQKCDIIFLGADIGEVDYLSTHMLWYRHENETASWASTFNITVGGVYRFTFPNEVNNHRIPLYYSFQWTDGMWAQINETKLYWVYNFGWGVGYSYPGQTKIYFYLDTGGTLFYNGSYADFAVSVGGSDDKNPSPWYMWLWEKIQQWGYTIGGWIWDGIQWVWNTLKAIGDWIASTLTSLIGWLISIVKDIATKVGNIIECMLYGAPMLIILFSGAYYGEMLYKGRIPKFTKERRLLRKMRPRAILKQRARYQRRLKYPIVQGIRAVGAERRWRARQYERRTARYESATRKSWKGTLGHQEESVRMQWRLKDLEEQSKKRRRLKRF